MFAQQNSKVQPGLCAVAALLLDIAVQIVHVCLLSQQLATMYAMQNFMVDNMCSEVVPLHTTAG